ncbi:MAG: RagB/SusD family nutrient uptake outer membrane protein [Bacteroidales bacterium]|nr:RagB/SusD family nutrient uptake outer membrane protein [Bacteroidales bacterium]
MKNKIIILLIAVCAMSCNKFLNEMPDNRAELDSEVKLEQLMRSAYPTTEWFTVAEFTSDNIDECPHWFNNSDRFFEELFFWEESRTTANESPTYIWGSNYSIIATANNVLQAIDSMGGPVTPKLRALKGEALVVRAYGHFMLVNIFGQHYSPNHSETDMGIPYITEPETTLNPMYERGTVAEVYRKIEADLLEGLPLIDDAIYNHPKWRFNQQAANTFASRFFLFYQKWEEAAHYASLALGSNPREFLRDHRAQSEIEFQTDQWENNYIHSGNKCNFMLAAVHSSLGLTTGPYRYVTRFGHTSMVAFWETVCSRGPWGPWLSLTPGYPNYNTFWVAAGVYQGALNRVTNIFVPFLFEYTDPVAGIGYYRSVHVLFSAEEALLNRAEANVMLGRINPALADINLWVNNVIQTPPNTANFPVRNVLTQQNIIDWANSWEFYQPDRPTPKKAINPDFPLIELQRQYMYTILHIRRHEFLNMGMRLFDVKRYGIEIERRKINGTGNVQQGSPPPIVDIELYSPNLIAGKRSPRLVIQIPPDVVSAGMPKNPTEAIPASSPPPSKLTTALLHRSL